MPTKCPAISQNGWSSEAVRRIVVVRPNHRLGNMLLLTPLLAELERRCPLAEIELVCTGSTARAVFKNYPTISAIHSFPARSFRNPGGVLSLFWRLSQRQFDVAIDPVARSRAGRFITRHVRARAKLGYRWDVPGRDRMLTAAVDPAGAPPHLGRAPLHLLHGPAQALQAITSAALTPRLDIRLTGAERRVGRHRVLHAAGDRPDSPLIGFFANATGRKNYPPDWWRAVSAQLRRTMPRARFVEFVPADGMPRLAAEMPNVRSTDLRILGAMIAATDRMVVADSGVMHLAFAAKAQVLGLFKVTDPEHYGPIGSASQALHVHDDQPELAAFVIHAGLRNQRTFIEQAVAALPPEVMTRSLCNWSIHRPIVAHRAGPGEALLDV